MNMKLAKRFIIWAALMLITAFCVNLVGTVVNKVVLADMLVPAMTGYSNKGEKLLHPTLKEPDENDKSNGLSGLTIRALLDDERLVNKESFVTSLLFLYGNIDQSVILFDKDGMSEFSKGIFVNAYEKKGDTIDHIRYNVGLINVRNFCELDGAKDFYETLKKYPDAVIRVDSYSVNNFVIQPASLTVLDGDESEIKSFDFPCDGDIITADNVYIYDDNDGDYTNDFHGFCNKMTDAYLGERRSDKMAEKLVDDVDFSNDGQYVKKSSFGFGHYITKTYEVHGDYAMICVLDFDFMTGVILYIIIAGIPITLLTFLLGRRKKSGVSPQPISRARS